MRMKRQKIKGTGMKLTPNPQGEPDFYHDYRPVPQLNTRRILPPLPPLPSEKLSVPNGVQSGMLLGGLAGQPPHQFNYANGLGGLNGAPVTGAAIGNSNFDRMLGGPLGALQYGGSLSAAEARLHSHASYGSHAGALGSRHPGLHNLSSGQGPSGYSVGNTNSWANDDLLLAPGVSPYDSAFRLRYLEQTGLPQQALRSAAMHGTNPTNDPIQDELSAVMRTRNQQANAAAAAAAAVGSIYPQHQISSDRLLMERLRDLDRASQLKREQQDMDMLRRATGVSGVAGLANSSPFDRYFPSSVVTFGQTQHHPTTGLSRTGAPGLSASAADPFSGYANTMSTSVSDALREANELEEMALVKRAKARSLALAGALHQRFDLTQPKNGSDLQGQQQVNSGGIGLGGEVGAAGDRPSFGRPFGKRD